MQPSRGAPSRDRVRRRATATVPGAPSSEPPGRRRRPTPTGDGRPRPTTPAMAPSPATRPSAAPRARALLEFLLGDQGTAEAAMRRRGTPGARGEPDDGRRGDGDGRHPRRLPRLQRQQRACRSCPPTGSRPRSRTPTSWFRGNEVRIGGVRVGVVESIEPEQDDDGKCQAQARPEARQGRRAAAGRLDGDRPRALGARSQVPRDRQGQVRRRASPPARRSRSPTRTRSRSRSIRS